MEQGDSLEEFKEINGIALEEVVAVFQAVSEAFPMIVLANLTKNTYTMIKHDGFLADDLPLTGCYDDLIDYGVENIHENYQTLFLKSFSRENLLHSFACGKREVYVELYQLGRGEGYQWVSTHVIRVNDRNGDVCEVCINKVLDD